MTTFSSAFPGRRARYAVGAVIAVVLVAAIVFVTELRARYEWADGVLEQIEPRHARLAGLAQDAELIAEALASARAEIEQHIYPESISVERVGTDLQQRARQAAEGVGLGVLNSRILPAETSDLLDAVTVIVSVQGTIDQIRDLFLALAGERPTIRVVATQVQGARGRVSPDRISLQLTLRVNRERS